MNARDTTKVYIWRHDTGCGPSLYRKCHSHTTPGKGINTFESNPSRGTVLQAPHGKVNKCDKNVKYKRTMLLCTNIRAPRWTLTDPCKPEVRLGAQEESASPDWLAAPAMNARDTTKVYIWRHDTGCGPSLYRKCHSHNTPGKRHNNTYVEPLKGTVLRAPNGKGDKCDKNVKYKRTDALSLWHQQ